MADTKISALTAVTTPADTDEFAVNQASTSKKVTLGQVRDYGQDLITGNSGAANAAPAPNITRQILSANATANSTTTVATVMTTTGVVAGTYKYRYDIIVQSGATTTSVKFSVDGTGTVTKHLTRLLVPSVGVTAATGSASQATNPTTYAVYAHASTRTDAAVLGPGTDVDAINSDVWMVMEGIIVTTTSGNLVLAHASEVAASSQVMAGTMLELIRLA